MNISKTITVETRVCKGCTLSIMEKPVCNSKAGNYYDDDMMRGRI